MLRSGDASIVFHYIRSLLRRKEPPPPTFQQLLERGGWHPSREASPAAFQVDAFRLFDAAAAVLREFGGLQFGRCGRGVDFASSDVVIDPTAVELPQAELGRREAELGVRLYPLGSFHRSNGLLVIDERGRIYSLSYLTHDFDFLATDFRRALEMLLLGKRTAEGFLPSRD